jgi:hypothetical protein
MYDPYWPATRAILNRLAMPNSIVLKGSTRARPLSRTRPKSKPKAAARRPKTALGVEIAKAARRRRWLDATGRTYAPRSASSARAEARQRLEAAVLDTRSLSPLRVAGQRYYRDP